MTYLSRLLREPLLHFFIIGGLFFAAFAAVSDRQPPPADVITITPERIEQLVAGFTSVWKRTPSSDEIESLIDADVREEIYYREALALGLDTNDTVIRRRLRQKMEFLSDAGAGLLEPSDSELEDYLAANEEVFRRDARLAFEQIYLGENPDPESVASLLSTLQSDPAVDPSSLGERTLLP
ncbi:MAG: peptidyl-prolyl cis-trans isomerase, partial [Hyphomicrobiales bacterium]|nr:peptidyl-prolyl cis-trans isomerase [Hyphomicrobiales bacterium]